jgi:SAM-dependent methyltransferase
VIPSRRVFDTCAREYDRWFDEHESVYAVQVRLLRDAVPETGRGLEVGVGSGRFAVPLGIPYGIDPSGNLITMANARGIGVVQGEGEHLPFCAGTFDYVLMMTVICFLKNPPAVLEETFRVLAAGGELVVGFISKDGEIAARYYRQDRIKGRFLRFARFLADEEATRLAEEAGFSPVSIMTKSRGFSILKGQKPCENGHRHDAPGTGKFRRISADGNPAVRAGHPARGGKFRY